MITVNLSRADMIVMAVYIITIIAWGLFHSSRKSAEGYFLGGRGMPWPLIGLSMFAMVVSSSSLVGWSGDAYSTGISVFNYGISAAIIPIVFFLVFFLPFYLRNKIYTLPEFLEGRFDSRSRYYLSIITIIGYTFADAAVTLYAGALMMKMVLPDLDLTVLIWGLAIMAASYTVIGGLAAVMWVDLVQSIVLVCGSIAVTVTAFVKAGGWSNVMASVPEGHLSLIRPVDDPSVPWPTLLITLPLLGFYFWGLSQSMVQRTLSARSINDGRWGNLFAGLLNFAIFFLMVIPGLAGRVLYPGLEKGDQIYPKLVFELLPAGITGLVVIGFIAAMTSTLSSILNSAQTLVTMDIVSKIKRDITPRQQVIAGNIAGLIIVVIAASWAPNIQHFDSVVKYFQQLLSYMAPPVVAVFLTGLFWKRANGNGAFAGLLSGFVMAVLLLLFLKQTPMAGWHFLYVAPVIFAISLVVVIAVSLMSPAPQTSVVERYCWRLAFYRNESTELAGLPWFKNYRILAVLLLIATALFVYIWR